MSSFSFDQNESQNNEAKAEEEAMNKALHLPMKTWYQSLKSDSFKEKYGAFPSFWQDLATWTHIKIVRKLYLKTNDMGPGEYDIDEIEKKVVIAMAPVSEETEAGGAEAKDGDADGSAAAAGIHQSLTMYPPVTHYASTCHSICIHLSFSSQGRAPEEAKVALGKRTAVRSCSFLFRVVQ